MQLRIIVLLSIICTGYGFADDLGTVGKTYPIVEPDMIQVIKNKAQQMVSDGRWDKIKQNAITRAKNQILHPIAIAGITHTKVYKAFYYNPMFRLNHDLIDNQGNVIAKAGLYNPLTFKPFPVEMIFIDGRDNKQVIWAVNRANTNNKKTKIVLTAGLYINLDKQYKIWFYYDQNGSYTQRLGITHVPAIVNQSGTQIKVEEIPLAKDAV